ncbi:MAG TPA: hypothetical protein PKI03_07725 [Pseudomonadota bacterium]|nr:hypothetical protein [Pseudomonadota bacterium]
MIVRSTHRASFRVWLWAAVLTSAPVSASAEPDAKPAIAPKPAALDCSRAGKRKVRAAAEKAVRAKAYKNAIALLEPFASGCPDSGDAAVESAWLAGDLAVAYQRDGQALACKRLMERLVFPKSDAAQQGDAKLMSALQFNLDQCQKAFDAEYAALRAEACSIAPRDAIAAASIPEPLLPSGAQAACLALVPTDAPNKAGKHGKDGAEDVSCPALVLVTKAKSGAKSRRVLGTPFADQTFCCGLHRVEVGSKDGQALVRVSAGEWVRECQGGTATASLDGIFAWSTSALRLVLDASNMLW